MVGKDAGQAKSIMCQGLKTANCRSHSEYGGKLSYVSDTAGTGVREVRHLLYSAKFKDILTLRCQPRTDRTLRGKEYLLKFCTLDTLLAST